jgi:hypothetical protein
MKMKLDEEELILKAEIANIFNTIRYRTETTPTEITQQVERLFLLRSEIYEDLNQLQHKSLILNAAKLLQNEFPGISSWSWHPKQTSHPDEADLTGYADRMIVISAEVTTSMKPIGTIDTRMGKTLSSLNNKKGKRFYFVQTNEMLNRAITKIAKNNWDITPRKI